MLKSADAAVPDDSTRTAMRYFRLLVPCRRRLAFHYFRLARGEMTFLCRLASSLLAAAQPADIYMSDFASAAGKAG